MGWLWRAVAVCALGVLFCSLPASLIGGETVLLDFETDWCGICKVMDPVVEQLVAEGYNIRKVNGDHERELVARFRVEYYPTFVAVRDGQEVGRKSGQVSKADLVSMLGKADASKVRGQSPDLRSAIERPIPAAAGHGWHIRGRQRRQRRLAVGARRGRSARSSSGGQRKPVPWCRPACACGFKRGRANRPARARSSTVATVKRWC